MEKLVAMNLLSYFPLCFTIFLLLSCHQTNESITLITESQRDECLYFKIVDEIPRYYPELISSYQVDLRMKDLSNVDLTGREYDLLHSFFDNYTVWPDTLPNNFSSNDILNTNLNPGMNIRKLHERGITGKGIKIAIIDQYHNGEHNEFKERITLYRDYTGGSQINNSLHGPAVSSIAAGKNLGVAPDSEIIYFSTRGRNGDGKPTCEPYISSLKDIGDYNKRNDKKIDVLSLSLGVNPDYLFYDEYMAELKYLEKTGLAIFSVDMSLRNNSYHFYGLEKDPIKNPDDINSYRSIRWEDWIIKIHKIPKLSESFEASFDEISQETRTLLIPLDGSTTYAGYASENHYLYKFVSGMSWCPPYLSGLYALCRQVDSEITLDDFWKYTYQTGKKYDFQAKDKIVYGSIIQPVELLDYVEGL